jgi:hypothetical protein
MTPEELRLIVEKMMGGTQFASSTDAKSKAHVREKIQRGPINDGPMAEKNRDGPWVMAFDCEDGKAFDPNYDLGVDVLHGKRIHVDLLRRRAKTHVQVKTINRELSASINAREFPFMSYHYKATFPSLICKRCLGNGTHLGQGRKRCMTCLGSGFKTTDV